MFRTLFTLLFLTTCIHTSSAQKTEEVTVISPSVSVQVYLLNKSVKSIPLIIPGVMNPNLSPKSKSGVVLKVGQKIYFRDQGKRHQLLTITEEDNNKRIEVSSLIKVRKKELGLK